MTPILHSWSEIHQMPDGAPRRAVCTPMSRRLAAAAQAARAVRRVGRKVIL